MKKLLNLQNITNKLKLLIDHGVYGTEILSLANLIEDYNLRQSELKGYNPITLEVHMEEISDGRKVYMQKDYTKENDYLQIIQDFENLKKALEDKQSNLIYGKTVKEWAGLTYYAQLDYLNRLYNNNSDKIEDALEDIEILAQEYNVLQSSFTEYKNRKFEMPQVEYDSNTGRVIKMVFTQM